MMDENQRRKLRDHIAGIIVENQPKPIPINVGEAQHMADCIVTRLFAAMEESFPATDVDNDPSQFVFNIASRQMILKYLKAI